VILLDTNILVSYLNGSPGIAQQLAHHLHNTKDFARIPGLRLTDWLA